MDTFRNLWRYSNQAMPLIAAIAFVLIVSVTAVAALCSGTVTLPAGETCVQCIREWVGALSGWVAALAAGATIAVLLSQLKQMRRQSDYALGEDMVELAWEQNAHQLALGVPDNLSLYIVNLGRRPIRIKRIVVIERFGDVRCVPYIPDEDSELEDRGIDFTWDSEFGDYRDFSLHYQLPGRSPDSNAPQRASFRFFIMAPGDDSHRLRGDELFDIEVHYQTLGESLRVAKRTAKIDLSFFEGLR